jgi:Uri superfamily endonuclease
MTKLEREAVKPLKGVYVLIIQVEKEAVLNVGALGTLTFKPGLYAYVGSAQATWNRE